MHYLNLRFKLALYFSTLAIKVFKLSLYWLKLVMHFITNLCIRKAMPIDDKDHKLKPESVI